MKKFKVNYTLHYETEVEESAYRYDSSNEKEVVDSDSVHDIERDNAAETLAEALSQEECNIEIVVTEVS